MKKKADLLKGMKMPEQKMAQEEAAMDLEGLGEEGLEPVAEAEMEEETGMEPTGEPEEEGAPSMLADATDDELVEEMRKRGLIDEGEEAASMEEPA